jgi:hypothetical protein
MESCAPEIFMYLCTTIAGSAIETFNAKVFHYVAGKTGVNAMGW